LKIAPSILSANWAFLAKTAYMLEDAGADWIHVDVMDGHFVSELTLGPKMVADLRHITVLPLDVHLMVEHPENFIESFAIAGANHIYIHCELTHKNLKQVLRNIHEFGCKAGLAINPESSVSLIDPFLDDIDHVLVMSVNPGKAGQKFMPDVLSKIVHFQGKVAEIVVDGGINEKTAALAADAGATTLVSGTYIFGHPQPIKAIQQLKIM
jgi:ribulose-phosphate 3-epimerase